MTVDGDSEDDPLSMEVVKNVEVAIEGGSTVVSIDEEDVLVAVIIVPLTIVGGAKDVEEEAEDVVLELVTLELDLVIPPELSLAVHSTLPTWTVFVLSKLGSELVKGAGPVELLYVKGVQVMLLRSTPSESVR